MPDEPRNGDALRWPLTSGRVVRALFTDRSHGDMRPDSPGVARRRAALMPSAWSWVEQVHGADVVRVGTAGEHAGRRADALIVTVPSAPISVRTADCVPILLAAEGGALAVVHAGWRGLLAGVVRNAADALLQVSTGPVRAALGPCIGPECYEFDGRDLAALSERFGEVVGSRTRWNTEALDLRATAVVALEEVDATPVFRHDGCTSCGDRWFSHRGRSELERQALVAWLEEAE